MTLTPKKSIFLLLFASFQVLIFLSFYTLYQFIIISFFLVFLLFYFWYFKLKVAVDLKEGLLWFVFILLLSLSSIFSHSLPLSLETIIFYISSFCIYIFFRSLGSSKLFSKSELVGTFLLVGLVLSAFFILFFSFPETSTFLPGNNLFTTKNGHSHFAAFLVFLIPLGWWFVNSSKFESFTYRKPILILLYTLLVFTFGRIAILLALIQLFFIHRIINQKLIKNIYLYLTGATLIILLFVGAMFSSNSSPNCAVQEFRNQLCKPISTEARPVYFKQAIRSFKAYPLFGYGPGTFSLITKRFNTTTQRISIYAHNNFLQTFAESGVFVGISYVLLIGLLYRNMYFVLEKRTDNNKLDSFLYLGLASLFLNSLIDFDWDLFPIFQMTVIFIAVVLWDYQGKSLKNNKASLVFKNFIKYFWLSSILFLISLGAVNVVNQVLVIRGNEKMAFKIFPYFYSPSKYFLIESNLLDEQLDSLYNIYENHDNFILHKINNETDPVKKIELYKKLMEIRLWDVANTDYYQLLLDNGMYEKLGEVSYNGLSLLVENENSGIGEPYAVKGKIINFLFVSAKWHERNGELIIHDKYYDLIETVWKRDRGD